MTLWQTGVKATHTIALGRPGEGRIRISSRTIEGIGLVTTLDHPEWCTAQSGADDQCDACHPGQRDALEGLLTALQRLGRDGRRLGKTHGI